MQARQGKQKWAVLTNLSMHVFALLEEIPKSLEAFTAWEPTGHADNGYGRLGVGGRLWRCKTLRCSDLDISQSGLLSGPPQKVGAGGTEDVYGGARIAAQVAQGRLECSRVV